MFENRFPYVVYAPEQAVPPNSIIGSSPRAGKTRLTILNCA
jgi:hypothetical protein